MNKYNWIKCSEQEPPLDVEVMTKIDDAQGVRNEQSLKLHQRARGTRKMWFVPDLSVYVYYTPTHWARM